MRRLLLVLVVAAVAAGIGYFVARGTNPCRYVVTEQAEFIHLDHSSVVILGPNTLRQMFGDDAKGLTLFYGFNRIVNEKGERGMVDSSLLPMSGSVRALFFSGDMWPDLVVPVYAEEKRQQVVLRIDLTAHRIEVGERRDVSQMKVVKLTDGSVTLVAN